MATKKTPEQQIQTTGKAIVSPFKKMMEQSRIPCKTKDDYTTLGESLKAVKQARKEIKAQIKEPIIDPIYQGLTALRAQMNAIDKPLAALESRLKEAMGSWTEKEHQKQVKKAEKKAAKAATEEQARDIVAVARQSKPAPEIAGLRETVRWDFDVVDPEAVPAYFQGAELRKIQKDPILKLIRATEGKVEIPGISPKRTRSLAG